MEMVTNINDFKRLQKTRLDYAEALPIGRTPQGKCSLLEQVINNAQRISIANKLRGLLQKEKGSMHLICMEPSSSFVEAITLEF